jgi:hypothetical protein
MVARFARAITKAARYFVLVNFFTVLSIEKHMPLASGAFRTGTTGTTLILFVVLLF